MSETSHWIDTKCAKCVLCFSSAPQSVTQLIIPVYDVKSLETIQTLGSAFPGNFVCVRVRVCMYVQNIILILKNTFANWVNSWVS